MLWSDIMNTNNLLKMALETIYKYPELQNTLSKTSERNKLNLKILQPLSYFYNFISNLTSGTLVIAVIAYAWSMLALISVGLFDFRLSPYFLIYLIILSSAVFLITLLIKMSTSLILGFLEKQVLKEFKISNTEKYLGNYISNGEKYFKTISNDSYLSIPESQLSSIQLDRKLLDLNFQANGLITELISKKSNNTIFLQLEIIN